MISHLPETLIAFEFSGNFIPPEGRNPLQKKRRHVLLPLFLLALAAVSLLCLFTAYQRIQSGSGTEELPPSRMLVAHCIPKNDSTPEKGCSARAIRAKQSFSGTSRVFDAVGQIELPIFWEVLSKRNTAGAGGICFIRVLCFTIYDIFRRCREHR